SPDAATGNPEKNAPHRNAGSARADRGRSAIPPAMFDRSWHDNAIKTKGRRDDADHFRELSVSVTPDAAPLNPTHICSRTGTAIPRRRSASTRRRIQNQGAVSGWSGPPRGAASRRAERYG